MGKFEGSDEKMERGVSELVAVLLLLGMTITMVGIITVILWSWPRPVESLDASLSSENLGYNLILKHLGGDVIRSAFKIENGAVEWVDLELRLNGVIIQIVSQDNATLNDDNNPGKVNFCHGDVFKFPRTVVKGDWLAAVYRPLNQILFHTVF